MESRGRECKHFANSDIEIDYTVAEESFQFPEYYFQLADEELESSIEQMVKEDLFINSDNGCKSPTNEESFKTGASEVLFEDNYQLELLDMESISDFFANQSSVANASLHSNDLDVWLFKYLSYENNQDHITGSEILPSPSNVPETLKYAPSVVISHTSENHIWDRDHNYANIHFLNVLDSAGCNTDPCESDDNYANIHFLNVLDSAGCNADPCDSDHNYASKTFLNILDNTESMPGPSHSEEIDTEGRNRFDPKHDSEKNVRTHTLDIPYACHVCGSKFWQIRALDYHLSTHAAKRLHSRQQCDTLETDSKVHSGRGSCVCQRCVCRRAFGCRASFVQDVCTSTGEKPYVCSLCERGFYWEAI